MTIKHDYLSTGCLHGEHDYCNSMVGQKGAKRPAQCKFCDAKCRCNCHGEMDDWKLDPVTHDLHMRIEELEDWIMGKGYDLNEVNAELGVE